jgi:hypothetical protein
MIGRRFVVVRHCVAQEAGSYATGWQSHDASMVLYPAVTDGSPHWSGDALQSPAEALEWGCKGGQGASFAAELDAKFC